MLAIPATLEQGSTAEHNAFSAVNQRGEGRQQQLQKTPAKKPSDCDSNGTSNARWSYQKPNSCDVAEQVPDPVPQDVPRMQRRVRVLLELRTLASVSALDVMPASEYVAVGRNFLATPAIAVLDKGVRLGASCFRAVSIPHSTSRPSVTWIFRRYFHCVLVAIVKEEVRKFPHERLVADRRMVEDHHCSETYPSWRACC